MRRKIAILTGIVMILMGIFVNVPTAYAVERKEVLAGKSYDLGEKDEYQIDKAELTSEKVSRFYLIGDISEVSMKNGFSSYAVESGNLKLMVDTSFGKKLVEPEREEDWHIITDKSKIVDSVELEDKIETGAIILQTSKDGKAWINVAAETDIYNKLDAVNKRTINGEQVSAFYETSNVQITAGCYYRIIVAYKLERVVEPSKVLFVEVKNTEQKERMEIYEFYAHDSNVNPVEELNIADAYEFSDVCRVDSQDGFENPTVVKSDDPHNDWTLGKFYVSGYTDVIYDEEIPVFLKVPEDKAVLWFNLEHELDKCNGRTDVKVEYIATGSDVYFGTPTISDFGRGTLIIRKTDKNNRKERYIYTNYLEASATAGANTRVDLFEEGDYEVALDYQLHYDKPFVFGTTTTKTLTYRVFFKFKVRNGDISAFIRDVDTNQFVTNANIAENGFYIDVANSQYLTLSIKREVLSESMDGLVEDTKFSGVAKEGRHYTEEGIYTVTVKNMATGDSVEKKVYVGNTDILKAHMVTGVSIGEINERLAVGAYIDEKGYIVDVKAEIPMDMEEELVTEKEPSVEVTVDVKKDTEEVVEGSEPDINEEQTKPRAKTFILVALVAAIVVLGVIGIILVKEKRNSSRGDGRR